MTIMTDEALPILYRDCHFMAVNKPPGMLVHRSDVDRRETVFAMRLARDQAGCRVYSVHRLDRPTSGALLFALSPEAARKVSDAFQAGLVCKTYLAIVRGITDEEAVIDHPLREIPDRFEDRGDGEEVSKEAVTVFRRLAAVELPMPSVKFPTARYSLLEVTPRTGRRHQIRRHLKHVFHPIIGDTTYGDGLHNRLFRDSLGCRRLLLHASALSFRHPWTGENVTIAAPLCGEFAEVIIRLGWRDLISGYI